MNNSNITADTQAPTPGFWGMLTIACTAIGKTFQVLDNTMNAGVRMSNVLDANAKVYEEEALHNVAMKQAELNSLLNTMEDNVKSLEN